MRELPDGHLVVHPQARGRRIVAVDCREVLNALQGHADVAAAGVPARRALLQMAEEGWTASASSRLFLRTKCDEEPALFPLIPGFACTSVFKNVLVTIKILLSAAPDAADPLEWSVTLKQSPDHIVAERIFPSSPSPQLLPSTRIQELLTAHELLSNASAVNVFDLLGARESLVHQAVWAFLDRGANAGRMIPDVAVPCVGSFFARAVCLVLGTDVRC